MRVAGEFLRHVHQDVGGRIAGIGVEHEIELDAVLVADDRHVVAFRPPHQAEPEQPVERQGPVEVAHANADVVDPLDCDRLGHNDLRIAAWVSIREPFLVAPANRPAEPVGLVGPIAFGRLERAGFAHSLGPAAEPEGMIGPVAGRSPGFTEPLLQLFFEGRRIGSLAQDNPA